MKRWPRLLLVLLLVLVSLLGAAPARAEIICTDSLEWIVADSDLIVRGTIGNVIRGQGFFVDNVWDKVTVRVRETLKGKHEKEVSFIMCFPKPIGGTAPDGFRPSETEFLFFLQPACRHSYEKPPNFGSRVWALRHQAGIIEFRKEQIVWSGWPVFAMDFKTFTKPENLLKAVRAAAAVTPAGKETRSELLSVPYTSDAYRALASRSGVLMIVPVDGRLENKIREWLNSKEPEFRYLGIEKLVYFQSTENIRVLKNLLGDPEYLVHEKEQRRYRYYPFRDTAFKVLTKWGIKVEKPIIEELVD